MIPSRVHSVGLSGHDVCSCGLTEPHPVARRPMCDGAMAQFWSDGLIVATDTNGVTRYCRTPTVRTLWAVVDTVALYDARRLFPAIHWSSAEYRAHFEIDYEVLRLRARARGEAL